METTRTRHGKVYRSEDDPELQQWIKEHKDLKNELPNFTSFKDENTGKRYYAIDRRETTQGGLYRMQNREGAYYVTETEYISHLYLDQNGHLKVDQLSQESRTATLREWSNDKNPQNIYRIDSWQKVVHYVGPTAAVDIGKKSERTDVVERHGNVVLMGQGEQAYVPKAERDRLSESKSIERHSINSPPHPSQESEDQIRRQSENYIHVKGRDFRISQRSANDTISLSKEGKKKEPSGPNGEGGGKVLNESKEERQKSNNKSDTIISERGNGMDDKQDLSPTLTIRTFRSKDGKTITDKTYIASYTGQPKNIRKDPEALNEEKKKREEFKKDPSKLSTDDVGHKNSAGLGPPSGQTTVEAAGDKRNLSLQSRVMNRGKGSPWRRMERDIVKYRSSNPDSLITVSETERFIEEKHGNRPISRTVIIKDQNGETPKELEKWTNLPDANGKGRVYFMNPKWQYDKPRVKTGIKDTNKEPDEPNGGGGGGKVMNESKEDRQESNDKDLAQNHKKASLDLNKKPVIKYSSQSPCVEPSKDEKEKPTGQQTDAPGKNYVIRNHSSQETKNLIQDQSKPDNLLKNQPLKHDQKKGFYESGNGVALKENQSHQPKFREKEPPQIDAGYQKRKRHQNKIRQAVKTKEGPEKTPAKG